jgi:predicted O-methyltransferase YrrM
MSSRTTPPTQAHLDYLAVRARQPDRVLDDLVAAAAAAGLPEIRIAPEQGALFDVLLRAAGTRDAVEVGTLGGYSGIWLARALAPGGRLRTIELDATHAAFAREWFDRAGVGDRIDLFHGDARQILPQFADASADAMFVDADKDGYAEYVEQAARILRPGGLLLVDNAFAFGRLFAPDAGDDVQVIRRFNDAMAARADFTGVIVPLGDGTWVAVRR